MCHSVVYVQTFVLGFIGEKILFFVKSHASTTSSSSSSSLGMTFRRAQLTGYFIGMGLACH